METFFSLSQKWPGHCHLEPYPQSLLSQSQARQKGIWSDVSPSYASHILPIPGALLEVSAVTPASLIKDLSSDDGLPVPEAEPGFKWGSSHNHFCSFQHIYVTNEAPDPGGGLLAAPIQTFRNSNSHLTELPSPFGCTCPTSQRF